MDFLRKLHSLFEKFFLNQDEVKIAAGEHFHFFVVFFGGFCFWHFPSSLKSFLVNVKWTGTHCKRALRFHFSFPNNESLCIYEAKSEVCNLTSLFWGKECFSSENWSLCYWKQTSIAKQLETVSGWSLCNAEVNDVLINDPLSSTNLHFHSGLINIFSLYWTL